MRQWVYGLILGVGMMGVLVVVGHAGEFPPPIPPAPPPVPGSEAVAPTPPPIPSDVPPPPAPTDTIPTSPAPPSMPATSPEAADPLPASIDPVAGTVNATRVNVRAGAGTKYEIVVTLSRGTALTIYEKQGDWLKIAYPEGQHCYIHPRHLGGEMPVDMPFGGMSREVTSDTAPVRVRNWDRSSIVGYVPKGATVNAIGMRGQWVKIDPPPTAYAWIFNRYVNLERPLVAASETAESTAAGEGGSATVATAEPEIPVTSEPLQKQTDKAYSVLAQQEDEYRRRQEARMDQVMNDIEARLAAIDEELEVVTTEVATETVIPVAGPPAAEAGEGFTGWVEYIGLAGQRPAMYRLVKGGEVLFLLRSAKHDLSQYINRMVRCDGDVELAPGFEANVMIVDQIDKLDEGPSTVEKQPKVYRGELPPVPGTEPIVEPAPLPETVAEEMADDGVPSTPVEEIPIEAVE